jgi:hypothetical protein
MDQELSQPSQVQQAIASARANNPDGVVVYFVKHKKAD